LGATTIIEDDIKEIEGRMTKLKTEVYGMDTKVQLNKLKGEILDLKVTRLNEEAENTKGSGKGFSGAKSYQEYVKTKSGEGEREIAELKEERQRVAERHMPSMEQKKMFGDLKKLLTCKLQASSESEHTSKGQRIGNNVNVLQL